MKITPSVLVSGLSGKTGGVVGSSWKGRAYVRKWVIPKMGTAAGQVAMRTAAATLNPLFRSLGTEIKDYLDALASKLSMSGWNLFVQKNSLLETAVGNLIPTPDNSHVVPVGTLAGSVTVATQLNLTWVDPVVTGYTKLATMVRDNAGSVFTHQLLTTLASANALVQTGFTTGHVYKAYIALYNPTTKEFGTWACTGNKTVT